MRVVKKKENNNERACENHMQHAKIMHMGVKISGVAAEYM
jgi:hypothetical protein